jgi:hypothetical protein
MGCGSSLPTLPCRPAWNNHREGQTWREAITAVDVGQIAGAAVEGATARHAPSHAGTLVALMDEARRR